MDVYCDRENRICYQQLTPSGSSVRILPTLADGSHQTPEGYFYFGAINGRRPRRSTPVDKMVLGRLGLGCRVKGLFVSRAGPLDEDALHHGA